MSAETKCPLEETEREGGIAVARQIAELAPQNGEAEGSAECVGEVRERANCHTGKCERALGRITPRKADSAKQNWIVAVVAQKRTRKPGRAGDEIEKRQEWLRQAVRSLSEWAAREQINLEKILIPDGIRGRASKRK